MQKLPFYVLMAFMILFIMPFFGVPLKAKAELSEVHTAHTGSDTDGSKHEGWTPISSEADLKNFGENGGCGYLTNDIELTEVFVPEAYPVLFNLCLNGHSITQTCDGEASVIEIGECDLYLFDETGNSGKITHAPEHNGRGVTLSDALFVMFGGSITKNHSTDFGGGIYVDESCEFIMNGGSISENSTEKCGGGINSYHKSIVSINDGVISGNTAEYFGGGNFIEGELTIEGGAISNNSANYGGGLYISEGYVKINSGEISENYATSNGGGIYVTEIGNLEINNGNITDNTAGYYGGGIFCNLTNFVMKDGLISGNTAAKINGLFILGYDGIEDDFDDFSYFNLEGGTISGNGTAENIGVAIYGKGMNTGCSIEDRIEISEGLLEVNFYNGTDSYQQYCCSGDKLTKNRFTREGTEFNNWNTEEDGSGEVFEDEAQIISDYQYVDLFAQWKTANASYKVNHYKQKLDGKYKATPDATDSFEGVVGSTVTPSVKSYSGFTSPAVKSETIKADGSTVVNYYYERKAYKLTWDLDGGSTTESYTKGNVKYGTAITAPVPVKKGYTFAGWNVTVPAKMPAKKLTIKALWEANYVTVKFNVNGGNALIESTVKVQEYTAYGVLPDATRTGYSFSGWYTAKSGGTKITVDTVCEGNITLYAHWKAKTNTKYKVEHYKQKLDGNYNKTPHDTEALTGKTNASVTPAVKEYKGFTAPVTQTEKIKADGTLVIKYYYTRNSYKLTWNLDGGTAADENYSKGNVKYGEAITAPVPTKKGYTFAGWNVTVPEKMPAKKLTIKALWEAKYATVKLNVNGGNALTESTVKVQEYTAYGVLPEATRTGYSFSGWYTAKSGGTKITADTVCEGNITLYAHWKAKTDTAYKVEHYKQKLDGTYPAKASETETLTGKTNASITPEVKTYKGFTSPELQTIKISADGTLVVKYYYTRNSYKLKWDFDGGKASGTYTKGTVLYGAKITAPVPVKEGYVFNGWDKTVAEKMPAKNVTYKATWRKPAKEDQVRNFVERFYTIILERPAEAEELENWTKKLINKEATGAQVAAGLINSREFQKKKLSDDQYVKKLYSAFFNREADPDGCNYWVMNLKNGTSRDEVLRGFINSAEFNNLCKQYGIDTGRY